MRSPPDRKPFAVANWKMAVRIAEGQTFLRRFHDHLGALSAAVDVVLCPPYTALHPLARGLIGSPVELGAQDLSAAEGKAHTGEISAELLVDAGCRWVLVGHWEIRHRNDESDADVNRKLRAALDTGLRPILLIGESAERRAEVERALGQRLPSLFAGVEAAPVSRMAMVYEPEWTIGVDEPAPPDHVAAGCGLIRRWIAGAYGDATAEQVRIIYGGSVTPDHAGALLASPDVDGLGAGRKGRDPEAFADIVRLIARAKGLVKDEAPASTDQTE